MSRNFELLQQLEDAPTLDSRRVAPPPAAGDVWAEEDSLRLIQRVFLLQAEVRPRVVTFAGVNHGDGCSQVCVSIARTLAAKASGSVCLVEANLRSPALPEFFGTTNHFGLTDALQKSGPIRSFAKQVGSANLWLLSSGALAADSVHLLSSGQIRMRLAELRNEFDFVIVDAPPLIPYDDAMAIGQLTDGLVLVLEAGSTRREAAQTAAANLRSSQVPILGAVLSKRSFPIPEMIYRRI